MPYKNLAAAAKADNQILNLLTSDLGHVEAAVGIGLRGYVTTEASVRRFREKHPEDVSVQPEVDTELAEDIGDGMDLGDETTQVAEEWPGFNDAAKDALHHKLDDALEAVGADPKNVAGLRISTYQSLTKDGDGNAHIHDLWAVKLLVQTKERTPEWPVVQPAPAIVISNHARPLPMKRKSGEKVAVILPDTQIGYRYFPDTDTWDPFHDNAAIEVALKVVEDVHPDLVLFLGDVGDFPSFGRWDQEPAFAQTTQRAINYIANMLGETRSAAPSADIVVLEGNHDRRLQRQIQNNAAAALGLRQAFDATGWPVLSLPFLANFADSEVTYVEGYPAGEYWFNDNLRAIHGEKLRSGGSSASLIANDEQVSTVFGHIHRIETQYKTRRVRFGGSTIVAHSPGCLCRIDGTVPSVHGSTGLTGRPIQAYENWQQGLSVVTYGPGDSPFSIESLYIDTFNDHRVNFGGKVYNP